MVKKIKACIFISGTGTNLLSLIKKSKKFDFPIKIELIISNKRNAPGLIFAKKYSIPFEFFPSFDQNIFEKKCLDILKKKKLSFCV